MSMDASPLGEVATPPRASRYRLTLLPRPDLVSPDVKRRGTRTTPEPYRRAALAGDAAVAALACLVTAAVRFGSAVPVGYWLITMVLPMVWLGLLALRGCYDPAALATGRPEQRAVGGAGGVLVVLAATTSYLLDASLPRGYVLVCASGAVVGSLAVRHLLRGRLHRARARGRGLRRLLVVGHADLAAAAIEAMDAAPEHGYVAVAACLPSDGHRVSPPHGIPIAADVAEVLAAVDELGVDAVAVVSDLDVSGLAIRLLAAGLGDRSIALMVSTTTAMAGWLPHPRAVPGLPRLTASLDRRCRTGSTEFSAVPVRSR